MWGEFQRLNHFCVEGLLLLEHMRDHERPGVSSSSSSSLVLESCRKIAEVDDGDVHGKTDSQKAYTSVRFPPGRMPGSTAGGAPAATE